MKLEYAILPNTKPEERYRVYILIGTNEVLIGKSYTLIGARENAITNLEAGIKALEEDNKRDRKERDKK